MASRSLIIIFRVTIALLLNQNILADYTIKEGEEIINFRERSKETIDKLHACLAQRSEIKKMMVEPVMSELAVLGQRVILKCPICILTEDEVPDEGLEWRRRLNGGFVEKRVPHDGDKFVLTSNLELIIDPIDSEDAGRYVCITDYGHKYSIYQLDVIKKELTRTVAPEMSVVVLKETVLQNNKIKVYTDWSSWSKCSKCGQNGENHRYGICKVKVLDGYHKPEGGMNMPELIKYLGGLACRSPWLHSTIASAQSVKDRESEIQYSTCLQACPKNITKQVILGDDGEVIEIVDLSKGYRAMKSGDPELPPMVKRKTIYRKEGSRIIFICPTDEDATIVWHNGSKPMERVMIKLETSGRVRIDILDRLVILKAFISDTGFYSCWGDGIHLLSEHLFVTEVKGKGDQKYTIAVTYTIVFGIVLYIVLIITKQHSIRGRQLA